MKLYNYLSRKFEPFEPIHQDYVGMYVCGPTVYGDPHLGHARSAVVFDLLYRYLEYKGYIVRYVRNITDVGHLEDEELEQGEDKIEKMARLTKTEPMEVAHRYATQYRKAMDCLNVKTPSIEPLASGHIQEQQEYIEKLLKNGWAYEVDGNVYFDVTKFVESFDLYGRLSGKKIEDLLAGQRELKQQDQKRTTMDFALWKRVEPNQIMHWNSPWTSRGVPGWHTECCVMGKKYLGHPFDIHGGGLDLQFPHHEAEIAQAYALSEQVPAHFWIYNNMITIDNKKMSKSLGNFITLDMFFTGMHERLSQAYSPQIIRFFLLRSHYRSVLDVSDEALNGAMKGLKRLQASAVHAKNILTQNNISLDAPYDIVGAKAQELQQKLNEYMDDDMNTPAVIAELFLGIDFLKQHEINTSDKETLSFAYVFMIFYHSILGLEVEHSTEYGESGADKQIETLVQCVLEFRNQARAEKDFVLSDKLRDTLLELNIVIKDNKDGTSSWEYK